MRECKFFLQGTCRYGDYCKFEHQVPSNLNYTSFTEPAPSILRQPNFARPQTATTNVKPTGVDVNTLVKSVRDDMTLAEKGGQWLLSSYAPFKEKPAFPGFSDQSFEEIRLGYYEAQKSGTLDQYRQQLQSMLQENMVKVKALQNPSPDIVNIIKQIYETPPSSCSGTFGVSNTSTFSTSGRSNVFGQQTSNFAQQPSGTSIFAKANQNLFSSTPPQTSSNIFGAGGNTAFASNQSSNIFGGTAQTSSSLFQNATQQQQGSIFGNSQQSTFGNQSSGTGIFAKANQTLFGGTAQQQSPSVFGQQNVTQQQPQNSNIFGGQAAQSQSIFGQPNAQNKNIFGSQNTGQQQPPGSVFNQNAVAAPSVFGQSSGTGSSVFGQNNVGTVNPAFATTGTASSVFGNAGTNTAVFGNTPFGAQPQTSNIFMQQNKPEGSAFGSVQTQPQNPSAFAQNSNQPNEGNFAQSHSASIFGGQNQQTGVFGQSQNAFEANKPVDMTIYSKLDELTEVERKWFESDELDIMNIPNNPPPYEFVF